MLFTYFSQTTTSGIAIIVGIFVYKLFQYLLKSFSRKENLGGAREKVLCKLAFYVIFILVSITLLFIWELNFKSLGIFLTGILGIVGLALFASWSYLSNVFSAFVLFFSVPYKINDKITVIDGLFNLTGTIEDMSLFYVYLKDEEGHSISIPNNVMLQKVVKRHLPNNESLSKFEN